MIDNKYAAGFFDGEGSVTACIRGGKHRRPSPTLLVCISNTNKQVLKMHKDKWGGSLVARGGKHLDQVKSGRWQQQYQWSLSAKMAKRFLVAIAPYVFIKKKVVNAALKYIKLQETPYRGRMDYKNVVRRGGRYWVSPRIKPSFNKKILKAHGEIIKLNSRSAPYNVLRGSGKSPWMKDGWVPKERKYNGVTYPLTESDLA